MPAPALRVVKMRRHSFAPRSVRNSRSLVHFHSAGAACAAFLFARQFAQHPASYAGCLFLCLTDWGVLNPLLPFGLSSPVTEQLKLALRGKVNFAACLTLGCSFYPTKKSKISLWGPLLHLPKCGTYITFLLRVCFSHSHNRADDGTNRTPLTGRGRRLASHDAHGCLITHQAREVAEFTPQKVFSAGTPKVHRGVQEAVAPPVNAWLSGA